MGDQVKPDVEVVTHNALGHVLDHPHVKVRITDFKCFTPSEVYAKVTNADPKDRSGKESRVVNMDSPTKSSVRKSLEC